MKRKDPSWCKRKTDTESISGGPLTGEGKQISSRNATKHGCCSTELFILPTESLDEFKSLESSWFRAYQPSTEIEVHLVRQLAHADWFLQRSIRSYAQVELQFFEAVPNPMHWDECHHRMLSRFLRYQTAHTNTVAKRVKAIEDYRKSRAMEAARAQDARHKDEKVVIAKSKLEIFRKKNEPEMTWDEHLERMRKQAEFLGLTPRDPALK